MILSINGWPGVGKLTVGSEIADRLGGRLLDNHTIINVAKALTDYGSPAYYDAIRSVRDVAFQCVSALPRHVPVILTNVIATGSPGDFAEEYWRTIRSLAVKRRTPLLSVALDCEPTEQARRIVSAERRALKKMREQADIVNVRIRRSLFDDGADYCISIDNTDLSPAQCAEKIIAWARAILVKHADG